MAFDKLTLFGIYALSSLTLSGIFFAIHYVMDRSPVQRTKAWRLEIIVLSRVAAFTFLWYSISITFTMFNKWFLTTWEGGFSFSALYTGGHMCYKFIFSRLWQCKTGTEVESFTWKQFLILVLPIGVTTAIDIMFSNISLEYITITLYTITKTSVIAWTFLWALVLKIEKFKLKTFVVVCFICIGISLAVASPTHLSAVGLTFCLLAAAAGGLRWALTEQLVRSSEQCKSPFVCMHHIAPVSASFMVPVGLAFDGVPFMKSHFAQEPQLALTTFGIIFAGGILAFTLILVEVKLVQLTSSLTMGVLGQLKELLQIILAIIIFKDQVTTVNAAGLGLALLCVGVYKWIKRGENLELLKAQMTSKDEAVVELQGLLGVGDIEFDLESVNDDCSSTKNIVTAKIRVKNSSMSKSAVLKGPDRLMVRQASIALSDRKVVVSETTGGGEASNALSAIVELKSSHLAATDCSN